MKMSLRISVAVLACIILLFSPLRAGDHQPARPGTLNYVEGQVYLGSESLDATKALANEWASRGINVNAIAPGYMATDNTTALRSDAARSRQLLEGIPAGRWGEPKDIAGAALYLCSSASDYVHGHVLAVDGGWLAR
jgi:NADP-dependent 3-hydroxy acid dehydrogenase YdfG